jgi:hypothetical protein
MSFAELLLSKKVTAAMDALVSEFEKGCPPPDRVTSPISSSRVGSALDRLYAQAGKLVREEKLGILRRAALGKSMQSSLLKRGYPADIVVKVTGALLANVLVKSPPQTDNTSG